MNSRERVLTALQCKQPDRVPYCEIGVDKELASKLLDWSDDHQKITKDLETMSYTIDEIKQVAEHLNMDNISYLLRAPVFAQKTEGQYGRKFYGDGLIKTEDDISMMELPDPKDPALYEDAKRFTEEKGEYAAFFVTRAGLFPAMLSMGYETFSIALFENRSFLEKVLERYFDWTIAVAERVCSMGFDVFVTTDDMAFKTGPLFSPQVFREIAVPYYQELAKKITLPWFMHSDGNILPLLDEWVKFGISGIHPLENGTMDIEMLKREYGKRLCLLGNVDLNYLGNGTPEEVDSEVKRLISILGPGGGYIVTSGNSLASYLIPENVRALSKAVQKYGTYA